MQDQKERVIDELMRKIIAEKYAHGLRLPAERSLCEDLSISRSSLRESITVLSNWNVVKPEKGSGIKVLGISFWRMQTIPYLLKYETEEHHYLKLISEWFTIRRKIYIDALSLTKKKKLDLSAAKVELNLAWENRENIALFAQHESNFIRELFMAADLRTVILLWNSVSEIYIDTAKMIPIGISIPAEYFKTNVRLIDMLEKGQTIRAVELVNRYLKKQDKQILDYIKKVIKKK